MQFPTGGKRSAKESSRKPATGLLGPLIRCDSGADGIVRMKETESGLLCFSAPCCHFFGGRAFLLTDSLPISLDQLSHQLKKGGALPREVFL